MTTQLSLWELPPEEDFQEPDLLKALADVAWSYSRRSTLERCFRAYYYEYYGASKRTAGQETDKETIRVLKQLKNRYKRTGEILHLVIGNCLRKAQTGENWNTNRLIDWANTLFQKDLVYSQTYPDGEEIPTEKYPPTLLSEFYYRDPKALEKCKQIQERLVQSIIAFATEVRYQPFRLGAAQTDAIVEKPFKLSGLLPCRIDGKVDVAYQQNGIITIVDWKSGTDDSSGDDSLQLAAYALWAIIQGNLNCLTI